jgi:hypothetical protein
LREPPRHPDKVELAPQRSAGRWPPGMEDTDQGINGCFRRRYERHMCRRDRSVPGVVPGLFDCVAPWGGGGGDEETRTPDPLLAKEVLYQLSYVPSAVWWWAFLDSNQRPLPYQGSALTN